MLRKLLAFTTALAALACGPSFKTQTPPGFVELEDQNAYDYRATTADGLVIAVREIDNDPKGEMAFWLRAVENHMRQRGGYALLGTHDVQSADGVAGKQLRFGHDEEATPHLYYVTIFVTDDSILLFEAGGTKELMNKHAEQLDWALKNFQAE